MIIPNNFTEARIRPNEDNTFKIDFFGVIFQDHNGTVLDPATVILPRVKISTTTLDFFLDKAKIEIKLLPDENDDLQTIYIPKQQDENNN